MGRSLGWSLVTVAAVRHKMIDHCLPAASERAPLSSLTAEVFGTVVTLGSQQSWYRRHRACGKATQFDQTPPLLLLLLPPALAASLTPCRLRFRDSLLRRLAVAPVTCACFSRLVPLAAAAARLLPAPGERIYRYVAPAVLLSTTRADMLDCSVKLVTVSNANA